MEIKKDTEICCFCGRGPEEVPYLINGILGCICPECLNVANKIREEQQQDDVKKEFGTVPKPKEIKEFLDQYVIGQDRVKERVAVAVYNHYKRINDINDEVEIDKSNILVLGSTGTGKCVSGDTKIKVRNKKTGEIYFDTINNLKNILISSTSND